jgi:hypothetical protein
MYINLSVLGKANILFEDVVFLAAISQKESEFLINNLTDTTFKRFETLSLLTNVKSKKKDEHPYVSLRLNEAGKQLLSDLEEAEIEEQDEKVLNWLCEQYLKLGKTVGNKKRTARHIRDFRIKSGIEKNNLIKICLDFISDDDNMEYNNILEFAFYKPMTAFQTRFQLEDSRLFKHFIKHRERLEKTFETD